MPDKENRSVNENEAKEKRHSNWHRVMAITLIAVLFVLTMSNLNAITSPFKRLNSILAPITIGLIIAYLCNPLLRFFEYKLFDKVKRRTVNRAVSMLLTYLVMLALVTGFFFLLIPALVESVRDIQVNGVFYITRLIDSINKMILKIPLLTLQEGDLLNLEKFFNFILDWMGGASARIISNAFTLAGGALTVLKNISIGILVSIYVMLSKERLHAGCLRLFRAILSEKNESYLLTYASEAHRKFGGFIVGKFIDSLLIGIISGILFSIFRIPYAMLIAAIIGVTNIIPFFGPFIGAIPSAVIILIASPMKALVFVLLIVIIQQFDGNVLGPWILGDRIGLSSLGVVIAIVVMSGFFGFLGMLIGVPLFALLITILDDYIEFRLKKKGYPTKVRDYYPATAFIRPSDNSGESLTLTRKFAQWVAAAETAETEDGQPVKCRARKFRLFLLKIGHFFQRTFSVKPIPADRIGGIYMTIAKQGMKTNRNVFRLFILTIFTIGIYPLYLVELIAQSLNAAAREDGKRTLGAFPFVVLTIVTIAVYPLVWCYQSITRMRDLAAREGKECPVTHKFFLCWALLGLPIVVGPFLAMHRYLQAFNQTCTLYNARHTFPLTPEEIREESTPVVLPTPPKVRKPIFSSDIESLVAEASEKEEAELAAEAELQQKDLADEKSDSPADDTDTFDALL